MSKFMVRHALVAAWLCTCSAGFLAAQDSLSELYGRGVHAFNSHNYTKAYEYLSWAVAQDSPDPRVYYFRAMALERLGRPYEAEDDYKKAAMLEAEGDGQYNVGMALQRVQGGARLKIESARSDARLQVLRDGRRKVKTRADRIDELDQEALRGSASPSTPPRTAPQDNTDPFGGGGATEPMPAPMPEAPVTPPAGADPFGGGAAPATPPAGADPFGGGAAPATPPAGADPFGGGAAPATPPAGADPFGGGAA
ncbi:MAG: hypothetical protein KDB14_16595, partial [Planctomycetales bacterium]|nr:hypothetical protein [Planctomycetales bacterium]